ncbi:hypothetical protein TruAng_011592 [Truncatella angustata]|nr:hypothetical protein TruAng_011592 [Truncatella angustata]
MPQVDATRNYYNDLGVTSSSSADDIKKQYRKLGRRLHLKTPSFSPADLACPTAMQWHPDRNRGSEEEASKKFQIIQAAFEILTDPTLKRQYNEARNKASSRFPTSSGTRGNPWANAGSDFPPPPRRTGANAGAASASGARTTPRPPPGAARYSNWGTGTTPRAAKTAPKDDPASAKAHYDAWTNMRSNNNANAPRKPPPTPGRPPTSATRESKTTDSEGIPRTASQKQKAQASFGNSARRTGFTPRSPGLGDEPPVTNNNYSTTRTRPNIFPDDAASTAQQNRHTSAMPDPLAQFRESIDLNRHSSPYATPGGEKTSLFGDGLNRAKSTRETGRTPDNQDAAPSFPFPRQRSNSTPKSSNNNGGSEAPTTANAANTGVKGDSTRPTATNGSSSKFSDRYRPNSTEPSQSQAGPGATCKYHLNGMFNVVLTSSASATHGATTQSPAGSTKYATTPCATEAERFCPTISSGSVKSQRAITAVATAAKLYHVSTPSGAAKSNTSSLSPFEQVLKNNMDHLIRKKNGAVLGECYDTTTGHSQDMEFVSKIRSRVQTNANRYTSFGFTGAPSTPGKRFASSSAENISTTFVDEQPEAWEFTAGGPPTDDTPIPSKLNRTQSGSRLGRRSPTRIHRRPVPPVPSADSIPTVNGESNTNPTTGFSAEKWGEKIGSVHFVPQPSTSASASPTRRSNSRKNSKPVKVTRGGSAGIVDEDDEIPIAAAGWQHSPKPPSGAQSPMAMDIDTPPIVREPEASGRSRSSDARTIPVEPTRPEWRAGDVDGNAPVLPQRPALSADTAGNGATQSKSAPSTAHPYIAQNGGSEDSEEFRANFADFKKVEPFTDPQPTGLQSFADLKTTLPFESRASDQIPLGRVQTVPHLDFPTAPVAPRLPPTMAVPGLRPSNAQWRKYAQDFYNYMEKWEAFNEKVLTHFATRQSEIGKRHRQFGRGWLEGAQGVDGASLYQAELEQDHDVRKQWTRTCDEHQQRVREFVTFRDRAK